MTQPGGQRWARRGHVEGEGVQPPETLEKKLDKTARHLGHEREERAASHLAGASGGWKEVRCIMCDKILAGKLQPTSLPT